MFARCLLDRVNGVLPSCLRSVTLSTEADHFEFECDITEITRTGIRDRQFDGQTDGQTERQDS